MATRKVPKKFEAKKDAKTEAQLLIQATVNSKAFKSKSHQRQSQILHLIEQRLRVAVVRAKDTGTKSRLKRAHDYAVSKCEASKRKTQRLNNDK